MDLYQYFLTNNGRNILKNPHYFPIYERHFRRFAGNAVTVFEIGTGEGGSCQMWKYYFGPTSRIITIDIADKQIFAEDQISVETGSQADPGFLERLVQKYGPPDIVIDDGSHMMEHINVSFDTLFPRMSGNGVYLVEDLDGAYWKERGGGLGVPTSFVERAKTLIDEMNEIYSRGELTKNPLYENIVNISFYHMVVVIERAAFINKTMLRRPVPLTDGN